MSARETLQAMVGTETSLSDWLTIDQARIDAFAAATGDHQWIHVDPVRAAAGPFGTTIAHGFLSLSLLPMLSRNVALNLPGVLGGLNYGIEKLRFITPVRCGARVRTRVRMLSLEDRGGGRLLLTSETTMEIEGEAKPALVSTNLAMILLEQLELTQGQGRERLGEMCHPPQTPRHSFRTLS